MFKKLVVASLLTLFLSVPVLAGNRMCPKIWDNVQSQTYTLTLGEDTFDVVFSGAYAGPCPQGQMTLYQGEDNLGSCRYMTKSQNMVSIECGESELIFVLVDNKLILVDPDALTLVKK